LISGDDNLPEREDLGERRKRHEMLKSGMPPSPDDRSEEEMEDNTEGSEDEFYREVKQKRAANLAAKAEIYSRYAICYFGALKFAETSNPRPCFGLPVILILAHSVYRKPTIPDPEEEIDGKRHITYQVCAT
jgi:hypothetical protein